MKLREGHFTVSCWPFQKNKDLFSVNHGEFVPWIPWFAKFRNCFAGVEFPIRIPSSPSPPKKKKTPHTTVPVTSENHPPNHLPVFQFPYFWHKKKIPSTHPTHPYTPTWRKSARDHRPTAQGHWRPPQPGGEFSTSPKSQRVLILSPISHTVPYL